MENKLETTKDWLDEIFERQESVIKQTSDLSYNTALVDAMSVIIDSYELSWSIKQEIINEIKKLRK